MDRRNTKYTKFGRAIARHFTLILMVAAIAVFATTHASASWTNSQPVQIAQATPTVDAAVARVTLNQLLEGSQNPQRQPEVYRTIVEGNYALATWRWGEAGGQTVLAKKEGRWTVLTSGGGAVDASTLQEVGVPAAIVQRLIERDQATWQQR
jgi:hypothetical protein